VVGFTYQKISSGGWGIFKQIVGRRAIPKRNLRKIIGHPNNGTQYAT
jgi:hypothetical protein